MARKRSVTIGWNQVTNATGYKVFWGTHPRSYTSSQDVGVNFQYKIGGLRPGTTYYISGKAYNGAGDSIFGNELIFKA